MTAPSISNRLDLARRLAGEAGRRALEMRRDGLAKFEEKGPQDFVTHVDHIIEDFLKTEIARAFPEDVFLGEETGFSGLNDGTTALWVVDPIDGTSNFIRGLPDWAVSIGIVVDQQPVIGAVFDAGMNQVFWAAKDHGAFCDDGALRVSQAPAMSQAMLMLGQSGRVPLEVRLNDIRSIVQAGAEFRRHGAAATGLLRVADGRVDAYFERHLNAWDVAGGLVIAREAGATAFGPNLQDMFERGGPLLCAASSLAVEFAELLQMAPLLV